MRNIKSKDRFKVWEITDKNGYAEVRMSESRKVREDSSYDMNQVNNGVAQNGYIGTNWYFVRFTGHAYNKLKEIQTGDTITNLSMDISREPYFGDTNIEINAAIDLLEKNNIIVAGSIPKLQRKDGVVYPRNVKITVFSFNTLAEAETESNNNYQTRNIDKAPIVEAAPVTPVQSTQYAQVPVQPSVTATPVQPIQYAQTPVQPQVTAADNLPF